MSSGTLRLFQLLVATYVFIAVLYTTNTTLMHAVGSLLRLRSTSVYMHTDSLALARQPTTSTETQRLEFTATSGGALNWHSSDIAKLRGLGSDKPFNMDESLFLSKAFSQSLRPSNIIPFYYRSNGEFDANDITATTLITSNRLQVFLRLVEQYDGPISVAVHVSDTSASGVEDFLQELHALYTSSPKMTYAVDVHVVLDPFDRQFNTWRNVARLFARTDYIMMLDVDFFLCTDFRSAIRASDQVMDKLSQGNAAFVIPAFEYLKGGKGLDPSSFPTDKKALVDLVRSKEIDMFHATWQPGHNSTEYERYYRAPPGEVYMVSKYQSAYEPYVIFKKDGPPWCDERFIGYGGNKAACLFEMYLSGMTFYVLADHFLIHQNHAYEESTRRNERKANRKLYHDFKIETCLKYIKSYHESGILDSPKGFNLQNECKKIKGLSKIIQQIIGG